MSAHIARSRRPALLLLLLSVLATGCGDFDAPEAAAGVLDLGARDLHDGPAVRLSGEWLYAPNLLVAPYDDDEAFTSLTELPEGWDESVQAPGARSGHGVATYRMRVILPPFDSGLGLRLITVGTAYRLYADGELIASAGRVTEDAEGAEARYLPLIVPLPPQPDSEIVLHLQASNFLYARGGPWEPLWIGDHHTLQAEREGRVALATFLAGTFAIIGLYHLVLWLVRRQDYSNLAFATLSFAIAVRGLTVDEVWIVELLPTLSWAAGVRVEYVSFLVTLGAAWAFVRGLFPNEVPRIVPRTVGGLCAFFVACTLVFPVDLFSRLLPLMQGLILISAAIAPVFLFQALLRRRDGAGLFYVGMIAIAVTGVHDVLLTIYRDLPTTDLFGGRLYLQPFGLLAFMLFQTTLLALRSGNAFTELEEAKVELEETRDAIEGYAHELEKRVAERTSALEDLALELERHSRVDGLTGIGNRRFFDEQLEATWADHIRRDSQLALALVDVDQFKRFNDSLGHVEGDAALRAVAKVLDGTATRPRDVVARYGGEELAIVLPDTDEAGALHLAEQMRAAVENLAIAHPTSEHGVVTVSVGVAAIRPSATHAPEQLVQLADAALYRAKDRGRNMVVTDTDLPEVRNRT